MESPIVFVGVATYDAISLVPRYPGPDERVEATDLVFGGGGPAATAAVAAKKMGADVLVIAPTGDDLTADTIADDLARYGISADHLQRQNDRRTQSSTIVCSADIAARAITTLGVRPFSLTPENAEIVRSAKWVHVDHLGWPAVEEALAGVPDAERPRISVDAGHPVIGAAPCDPARVALYVPPVEKLSRETGDFVEDAVRRVGAAAVVATQGGDGAVGVDETGSYFTVPGHQIDDFGSTLGAGDVFHGALVAAVASGSPLDKAMRLANAVAALSCRGVDGRSRIPSKEEAERFLAETARSTDRAHEETTR